MLQGEKKSTVLHDTSGMSAVTFPCIPKIYLFQFWTRIPIGFLSCTRSLESSTSQETMILRNASWVVAKGSSLLSHLMYWSSVQNKALANDRQKRELLPHPLLAGILTAVCSMQASQMQFRFQPLKLFFSQGPQILYRVKRWARKERQDKGDNGSSKVPWLL